ncbi:hypothetical protein CORC01_06223 [Colletotrichum orchidophilum]|uniref:NAD dependent epimerase/dehydratase n=1 Tax=Colletotrichum orchidophilum TaxID=1209926 RepID=A0A1G4BAV7_9PEZI|nr:uncharacterized protein CORC01_06223 [Colletotrichum orchidophilum]OHE98432.1 hypothetical protein CORC01_06223 [Colletotrichum orchidophilum]
MLSIAVVISPTKDPSILTTIEEPDVLIDLRTMPEMKVLVLGLPRTGTQSLADALIILGISPVYHMREVAKNAHQDLWISALNENLTPFTTSTANSPRNPWSKFQWDTLLSPYSAVSDFPPALFPASLATAYPSTPIILTTRSFESWETSMRDTLIHAHLNRDLHPKSPMESLANAYHAFCWDNDFEKNGRAYFERHHEEVRALKTGERGFLEFRPGDGWEPLCAILGVKVPDVPFPRSDDWVEYKKKVERDRKEAGATQTK